MEIETSPIDLTSLLARVGRNTNRKKFQIFMKGLIDAKKQNKVRGKSITRQLRDEIEPFIHTRKSSVTQKNYRKWLTAFIRYCREHYNCKTHGECAEHIQEYSDYLQEQGKWNGGFAPYGYKLEKGELKIAEDEVEVIKFIFDKFVHTTVGVTGIADYLNKHGIKKKQRQKTHRDSFSPHFIKSVLDNPVYCGKIAYQRRKTEKIPGQRGASHIVKQDKYLLFDGIHEAIVSEAAHQKRLETGKKCEKVHDLEHEHILSAILRCPVCGAGLYGNPNRKKKEDGSRYKDYYCYRCKHRKDVDGKRCDYRKQWNPETVNNAVTEIIKNLVHNPKFESAIREKIESSVDTAALEAEIETLNKQLKQQIGAKNKLGQQMDSLDVSDRHYDSKYADMQKRLDRLYEEIDSIEYEISTIQDRIDSIIQQKISGDNVYRYLLYFDKLYDKFTDKEKKQFMNSFIDSIEIYEDVLPSGRFLNSIHFKFPIFYEGEEIIGLRWDKDTTVEVVTLIERKA